MTVPKFPTMLRKMWSGQEVQDWIEANWPQDHVQAKAQAPATAMGQSTLPAHYEFPRADPVKAPGWVIDPSFVSELREFIQSRDGLADFAPDIEQIETVLIALESIRSQAV